MENEENIQQENQPGEIKSEKNHKRSRKLKFIIPVIIVAILFTAVCGIVLAKKKFKDGPEGFIMGKITENLNLSDIQKAQVEKIKDQIKEKFQSKKIDREALMDEFANEFKKDNLDKNKLIELSKKKDQNSEEMKEFIMDKIIEFHSILTAEQRNKAVETMKEMKNKFHDKGRHDGDRKDKSKNTEQ